MSAARREAVLDEFERSGMSGLAFARQVGIKYHTLATWVQKRRRQAAEKPAAKPGELAGESVRWLEAVVDGATPAKVGAPSGVLRVELPGGARLEIGSAEQVALAAELIRALEKGGRSC